MNILISFSDFFFSSHLLDKYEADQMNGRWTGKQKYEIETMLKVRQNTQTHTHTP